MSSRGRVAALLVHLAAVALLLAGWNLFWFLCDDAYIAFRYVSNARLGYGYTWNPPPFRPVEGYTSFLWVVLLHALWSGLDFAPPRTANVLALGFSLVSLALVAVMILRLRLTDRLAPHRLALLALILLGTVTNRTFLAWTSSGLETAMWSTLLLAWTFVAVFRDGRPRGVLATLAALMALTRPDGLLFVAATLGLVLLDTLRTRRAAPLLALTPLGAVALHLAWRLATYGFPLPNTYYAKHVGAWPLLGAAYLASFLLEYAYWIWLLLLVAVAVHLVRSGAFSVRDTRRLGAPAIGVATLIIHVGYYVVLVGGDHFEYRVLHHVVPLVLVSFPWLADRLGWSGRRTLGLLGGMLALGLVLPWTQWWHTRDVTDRRAEGAVRSYAVARHLPPPLSWYAVPWDALQLATSSRGVGIRHQGHKVFLAYQVRKYPDREEGARLETAGFPVFTHYNIGYPAWVMPHVVVIDGLGLNDLVIARNPVRRSGQLQRWMAHDRRPPAGYLDCFAPNVTVSKKRLVVTPREVPLTEEDIVACETRFLRKVRASARKRR